MTNNNKKILILEWEAADLRDGTRRYEKFKIITGSDKENLNFYSTFFAGRNDNKFKKGETYELSTTGNFISDSAKIIQGIDSGEYEFVKISSSLMIKELWEEKLESIRKLNELEEDLRKRKEEVNKVNQELLSKKNELNDWQSKFNNLKIEKEKVEEKLSSAEQHIKRNEEDLREKERILNQKKQELTGAKNEKIQLQVQFDNLQTEKNKMENEWLSPERKNRILGEKENLSEQLRTERRKRQEKADLFWELWNQELAETIQEKLEKKKSEQKILKSGIIERIGNDQKFLLENLLEKQEDFDLNFFDEVSQTSWTFVRVQNKLKEAKDKLATKLEAEEIEEICELQTEISKLESIQKQWQKMEEQQQEQFETIIGVLPHTKK